MRRPLIAALAMALTVGLTAACDTMAPGQALADMTMWEMIQRSANPDGTMGLQASLVQFSYQFSPLPGVTMPPAKPDPPGFAVSGTPAVNSVLSHWAELTDEQRHAVVDAIEPQSDEPPRFSAKADPVRDKAGAVLRRAVDELIPQISARIGFSIPGAQFQLVDEERENSRAWTNAEGGDSLRDRLRGKEARAGGCMMHFPPSIWKNVGGGVPIGMKVTVAHELLHCFQAYSSPSITSYESIPSWIGDGFCEFGAMDLLQVSYQKPPNIWTNYLTSDLPLFQRGITAMPWWFQLQYLRRDPWAMLPPLWRTGTVSTEQVYLAVGGANDDIYDTWASSLKRDPGYGPDWELHGVDLPPTDIKPAVPDTPGENGLIEIGAFNARPGKLTWDDGSTGVLRVNSANPIRVRDDGGQERIHITEGDFCIGPLCTCPAKTERAGEQIPRIQRPLWLGVAGGEAGNVVMTDVVTLEDYCKKKKERKKPKSLPQPPWAPPHVGGGSGGPGGQSGTKPKPASTGDPHLTSLDGHDFDFQASGEFTLIRSDSGDLEIQTRQQPRIRFDGKESDAASMNTAVAANVAGDRVEFRADKARPSVRVNGVAGERNLPKGGKISEIEAGYAVRWPDGTEMWVVNAGAPDSVSVLFGPASSRTGKLHGLIGPFDGDAMFDRAGRRYDKPDFDALYKKIGDSWRIRQSDSLFTYEPGESTEKFTRRELPAKPLTLADLSASERAAGEKACAGVPPELHDRCVFDVAVSGNDKYAVGYRTLDKLTTVGGGALTIGKKVGPQRLEAGQQQTFTINSDADTLYFATDADCTKPTSATVYWRITMPDGHDTLQVPMCADAGRQTTTKHGIWKIDVWVAPGADQGGLFAFHVATAGQLRNFDISPPKTVTGSLSGAGAEDRHRFTAATGEKVTLTSKSTCDSGRPLYWGLESPDGNRVTLRARVCDNIGDVPIPVGGVWSVAVYNSTADDLVHSYSFAVSKSE